MGFYIKDKESGEYMVFGCEPDWIDDDDNLRLGCYYIYGDDLDEASDFRSVKEAEEAILLADEYLENYEIVEVVNDSN